MAHPLVEVTEQIARLAKQGRIAVVFDLDSTLFCVSPRTQFILRELSQDLEFRRKFPSEAEILARVDVLPTDWGVRQVLERERLSYSLELFREVRDFWRKNFFASHHLDKDILYPSAELYVRHLHSLGAEIIYLTGRPENAMREGTVKALAHWGFPVSSPAHLIMKPSDVETDESYKALVLQKIMPHYKHLWFFENEPVIIEHVRKSVPQVQIIFMHSVHAGRAERPLDLPSIGMDYSEGLPK